MSGTEWGLFVLAIFSNKEEYYKWKAEKLKPKQEPIVSVEQQDNKTEDNKTEDNKTEDNKTEDNKTEDKNQKTISVSPEKQNTPHIELTVIVMVLIIGLVGYINYANYQKPKQIAEQYLKAIQLHDYEEMFKLSEGAARTGNVLINLIDWKFINTKKIDNVQEEYVLNISASNKLGMELKMKFIMVVKKSVVDEWHVTRFEERD